LLTLRGDVPAGAFPLLASGISACPPGTGKRGQADGAARHPYHGATPETATGTGALPGNVPIGGRAQAPANGSLGWTNKGNRRGVEKSQRDFINQPGVDAQRLRRVMIVK